MGIIKIGKTELKWGKESTDFALKNESYIGNEVVYFDSLGRPLGSNLKQLQNVDNNGKPTFYDLEQNAFGLSPWVYIIIDRIAEAAANIDLKLLDFEGNPISSRMKQSQKVRDLQKLLNAPQTEYGNSTFSDLVYMLVAQYCLTGNAYILGNPPNESNLRYTNLIVPRVSSVSDNQNETFSINYNNMTFTAAKKDVMHVFRPNMLEDEFEGHSPMQSLAQIWRANNAINLNEQFTHQRRGANGVIYNEEGRVQTPKQRDENQTELNRIVSNSNQTGRYSYMPNKIGFINLSASFKELQADASKLNQMRTIAAAYRYPSQLLNDPSATTYNNIKEAEKGSFDKAILPKLDLILENINKWLVKGNYGLETIQLGYDRADIPELNLIEQDKTDNNKSKTESVAGVQKDIVSGAITYTQGFNNLVLNMGYTEQEALKLLGVPTVEQTTNTSDLSLEDDPQTENANDLAQANLRGSVGGVQGILAIQASVAQGITDYSAAVETLTIIYGFTEEQARAVLGTPKTNQNSNNDE